MTLRELREAKRMTVSQLARVLATSESLVRRWENGTIIPSIASAVRLADALGVGYEDVARAVMNVEPVA